MSRIVVLLLQNEFLKIGRNNFIIKSLFGTQVSLKRVLQFHIIFALLYFLFTSVLPLVTFNSFSAMMPDVETIAPFYHVIVNLIFPLFMFFGLFTGAVLIFNMNVDENEQLLSLPVVIDDLVQYRITDVVIANLKSYLYFFFPSFLALYLAMAWSIPWVLLIAILSTLMALIGYLAGIFIVLKIAQLLPNVSIVKLFINTFMVCGMLYVVFINMFNKGYIIEGESSHWTWLVNILASNSISVWIQNMVIREFGIFQYLLVLILGGIALFYLWEMASKALYVMYYRIHVSTDISTIKTKKKSYTITFEKLNSVLHFIPSLHRTIIIKDFLLVTRKPNLAISVLIFVGGLIFLTKMEFSSVANPILFALYYASMFVISQLFLGAVGKERNNIVNIKLLIPSIAKYLNVRIQIVICISICVLIPLWALLMFSSGDFTVMSQFYRIILLFLNIVFGAIVVTYFSASFAEFEPSVSEDSYTGIMPMAMLLYWGVGFVVPIFFYNLDSAISSSDFGIVSLIILALSGITILATIVLCYFKGIRRIKNYF